MSYTGCMDQKLRRHGHGSYIYNNPFFKYTGEWCRGKKDGRGVLEMRDGSVIDAEFRDGEITGRGVRRWQDGRIYEGDFEEGEFHGQGRLTLPSGEQYVGDFVHNRRHGEGELTLADGTVFQGHFKMHKKHGQGIEYWKGGTVFAGTWVAGLREGAGKLTYAGGEVLEGKWQGGVLDTESEAKFEDPRCGFQYRGGWVMADGVAGQQVGAVPGAVAVGPIRPTGTGIQAIDPENEAAAAAKNAYSNSPTSSVEHKWVANVGAGDRITDWVFTVAPEGAGVALAEKGRVLQVRTFLLQPAPTEGVEATAEASGERAADQAGEGVELPRAVDMLRSMLVERSREGGDVAEEGTSGVGTGSGGSALLEESGFVVQQLPVGENGTVALPAMEVIEGLAAGIYEMRITDTTSFGVGSTDVGFRQLPELRIRISVGVDGGSGSKGGKKKSKKR